MENKKYKWFIFIINNSKSNIMKKILIRNEY